MRSLLWIFIGLLFVINMINAKVGWSVLELIDIDQSIRDGVMDLLQLVRQQSNFQTNT